MIFVLHHDVYADARLKQRPSILRGWRYAGAHKRNGALKVRKGKQGSRICGNRTSRPTRDWKTKIAITATTALPQGDDKRAEAKDRAGRRRRWRQRSIARRRDIQRRRCLRQLRLLARSLDLA